MRIISIFVLALLVPSFVHASVIITEIMYDVSGTDTGREWIEITNTGSSSVDVGGYKFFEANTNHSLTLISSNAVLSAGGSAVIAVDSIKFKIDWPSYSGTLFDSSFSLSNTGESIAIKDGALAVLNTVTYDPSVGAAGDGNTLQWNGSAFTSLSPNPGTYTSVSPQPPTNATSTTTTISSGGAPPEYIPIPTLRIVTSGNKTISSGADTAFTAVVYDNKGNRRDEALIVWSFGDGMQRTGANVYHTYYYPGEYIAVVRVSTSDGGDAFVESVVTVKDANIKIVSVSARGISLINNSSRTLDLSLWRLSMSGKEFKIPTGTQILAGRTILFPSQIIQLPISDTASLLYPSGEVSAMYPQTPKGQPSAQQTSFNTVQTVESVIPIISTTANIQTHDETVIAPSAVSATETAEGAALSAAAPAEQPKAGGLFKSPWFLGLLGVIALAGAAFIFL